MGVILVELWMVLLYCLITDGSSLNQLALPARKIGFFNQPRIVQKTRSAIDGPLSANLEKWYIILVFKKIRNNSLKNSVPQPDSIFRRVRFEVVNIFAISFVIVWLYFLF